MSKLLQGIEEFGQC